MRKGGPVPSLRLEAVSMLASVLAIGPSSTAGTPRATSSGVLTTASASLSGATCTPFLGDTHEARCLAHPQLLLENAVFE